MGAVTFLIGFPPLGLITDDLSRLPRSFTQVYRKDTFDAPGGDSFGERFGEIQFAEGAEVPEQPDILGGSNGSVGYDAGWEAVAPIIDWNCDEDRIRISMQNLWGSPPEGIARAFKNMS